MSVTGIPGAGGLADFGSVDATPDTAASAAPDAYKPDSIFLDDGPMLAVGRGEAEVKLGDTGRHVDQLQFVLRILDKLPQGTFERGFGRETERALSTFQREQGLTPTGRVDRDTLIALDKALTDRRDPVNGTADYRARSSLLDGPELVAVGRGDAEVALGARGEATRALQSALISLEFLPVGEADGAFGGRTQAALQAFQKDAGVEAHGRLDKQTLIALDRRLNHTNLDGTHRPDEPATPAPEPLTKPASSYLHSNVEREAYDFIERKLWTGRSWRRGIDLAVTDDDTLRILDRLQTLDSASYNNVLHALAATKNDSQYAPTLLDKFITRGTSQLGGGALSTRFLEQLEAKLEPLGDTPENKIFRHISPDSVDRLEARVAMRKLYDLIT